MKIVKIIALVLFLIVGTVLALASRQPDSFSYARSTTIKAPAEKIYPYLNDFKKGMEWMTYEKRDPNMKRKFSGNATGVGSIYEFDGNSDVGAGRMEIVAAVPNEKVTLKLAFVRPMEGVSTVEYTLTPSDGATKMTWAMSGKSNFIGKIFCLFINMDKMMAKDFDEGLNTLKNLAEKK